MSKKLRKQDAWTLAVVAMLLVLTLWNYGRMRDSWQQTAWAASDAATVEQLADRIVLARQSNPALQDLAIAEVPVAEAVEMAATEANIPRRAEFLQGIQRHQTRPIEGTDYHEKPITVGLDHVKLQQLIEFLYNLTSSNPGLNVNTLQLDYAGPEDGQNWKAEITLGQLVVLSESRPR